ncbi:putative membrane protein [Oxalobacteraceae bacterium GrIS 1.18]
MAHISSAPASKPGHLNTKLVLWSVLLVASIWVFLSNEVLLMIDYPLFHAYREKMSLDRWLLVPHAVCGSLAFIIGPFQFSSRIRQRYLHLHRLMGRCYVIAVYCAALTAIATVWGSAALPGNGTQAVVWMLTTTIAWVLARNGHIQVHRQWVARSYAVTFTFVSLRVLSVWPTYWNLSDAANVSVTIGATFASILVADLIMVWPDISRRRT